MKTKTGIRVASPHPSFKCPAMLLEKYREKLGKYGYHDDTEVLRYLAVGLWNEENGVKNSSPVRGILGEMTVRRHPFLVSLPHVCVSVYFTGREIDKVITLGRFGYLANLMNAIMEAFTFASYRHTIWLRREMHAYYVMNANASGNLSTYISRGQHGELTRMADRAGMSLTGLARTSVDILLDAENGAPGVVRDDIREVALERLRREGFTLRGFSHETRFDFYINDDIRFQEILGVIRKYRIPGTSEFLRRALSLLLEPEGIHCDPPPVYAEDMPGYFDENEAYMNERLSRRDFARSIYQ